MHPNQRVIILYDIGQDETYVCPIKTGTKGDEDKYIYEGWCKFVRDNELKLNDRLIMKCVYEVEFVEVTILRHHPR